MKFLKNQQFYEYSQFDGSLYLSLTDNSTAMWRDPSNKELYFLDPSTGPISLTELANPTSVNANVGNIVFVSETGDENGQKGNPLRPFDISSAVNTVAATGDLIYVYAGDYFLEQSLTPRTINWNFYFQPGSTVDFGDVSAGQFAGVIGHASASGIYVYGSGNFTARRSNIIWGLTTNVLEFNEIICAGIAQGLTTFIKGNKITVENDPNVNVWGLHAPKFMDVNEIYIFKENIGRRGLVLSRGDSYTNVNYIFSNGRGLSLLNSGNKYSANIGRIDSSDNLITAVNSNSGINSIISIGDASVFGGGVGISILGNGTKININNLLTNSGAAISLGQGVKNIFIDCNNVISSGNYGINDDFNGSSKIKYNIKYLESLSTHGIIHQFRSNNSSLFKTEYNINEIRCPSTAYGIYCRTVSTITAEYEVIFNNTFISARYPIYLGIGASEVDKVRLHFNNMKLYSATNENSVFALNTNTKARFTNVWANTDPHANLIPLWDGINVSDKIYPY